MGNCSEPTCPATITWAVNLKSMARVPLVPFDPSYPKAARYTCSERSDGVRECMRDNEGPWMSHFANCTKSQRFSKRAG